MIEDTSRKRRQERDLRRDVVQIATARTMAILSHLAIVIGMVLIGYRHFDNIRAGIAAATLYLLLALHGPTDRHGSTTCCRRRCWCGRSRRIAGR